MAHPRQQMEAAKVFGTTQPRISEIMNGHIDEFTIDSLVNMLSHAGVQMEVHFIEACNTLSGA